MKKKKAVSFLLTAWLILGMSAPANAYAAVEDFDIATSAETNKVILDCDMTYLEDDTYCMYILSQADAAGWIDLLGVTSVGGNCTVAEGTNAILNLLEEVGRSDIPVYQGTDIPLLGFRDLEEDMAVTGGFQWTGAYGSLENYAAPDQYHDLGELYNEAWGYSETEAQTDMNAAEFMIKSVKEYPEKVTIIAIGACTNVALACSMDPTFAENTAGIIYMGGAIDVPGNASATAELNWFYDPESVQICLNNDFPYQIEVPHDIASKVLLAKDVFDMMEEKNNTAITELFLDADLNAAYAAVLDDPAYTSYCWDAVTAAIFLCPDLITETEYRDVAIDLNRSSYSYGNAVSWDSGTGPYSSKNIQIVFNIDRDSFWAFVTDLYGTQF